MLACVGAIFTNICDIDLQLLFCRQTQKHCFRMKSTSVGMSVINACSVAFIAVNERLAGRCSNVNRIKL